MPTSDTLSSNVINSIVEGYNGDPFAVLGPHETTRNGEPGTAIRAFLPWASKVEAVTSENETYEMERIHPGGLFEVVVPGKADFDYRLRATQDDGNTVELYDPYAFPPVLSNFDLHLIQEGTHYRTYEKMGAHIREVNGVRGVHFAVWAPNAQRVSLVGGFNNWDGRTNPMRFHPDAGIWEVFMPGLDEGEYYKYEVKSRYGGFIAKKSDPYGFWSELRPGTASIVADLSKHEWKDQEWLQQRGQRQAIDAPMSIYEVHLGSWKRVPEEANRPLNYRELAHQLVDYVKEMGYTHIECMPLSEHPLDASWGYQTTGYYAVTSRYGRPEDFMYFVDHCHQNGIGVILDWVPAHFPRDIHGLNYFDGTHLYEHADPRLGEQKDWGTLVFNFGRNEVRNFLLSNALFWLDKYHIDGLRVDAVASMLYLDYSRKEGEWLPNKYGGRENLEAIDFVKRFNELVHLEHPDALTMAEESTAWPMVTRPTFLGGLGFDLKWNMGWMHDTLDYFAHDPIYRRYHYNLITFSMIYAFTEQFLLPLSHDEVVHGKGALLNKMPGDSWQQFANLRTLFGYMFTHPGKKLLFMGSEFGQRSEWTETRSLDWHELQNESHQKLQRYMRDLAHLYMSEPALWQVDMNWEGFKWLAVNDNENSVIAYARFAKDPNDTVVVACNFTPIPRYDYRLPAPRSGFYREIFNSDAATYWGSNIGNMGGVHTVEDHWAESGHALSIILPPLAIVVLKPEPAKSHQEQATASEQPEAAPEILAPANDLPGTESTDAQAQTAHYPGSSPGD